MIDPDSWSPAMLERLTGATMFTCPQCACIFWPTVNAREVWPDRFSPPGGCEANCACHDTRYYDGAVEGDKPHIEAWTVAMEVL